MDIHARVTLPDGAIAGRARLSRLGSTIAGKNKAGLASRLLRLRCRRKLLGTNSDHLGLLKSKGIIRNN